jgi:predicted metal-dependent phosphotriesterase family hydrolase
MGTSADDDGTVATVRGPGVALGATLMHEHVFVVNDELRANYPRTWDEEKRVAEAVTKLRALNARGVDTIADPTVLDHIPDDVLPLLADSGVSEAQLALMLKDNPRRFLAR